MDLFRTPQPSAYRREGGLWLIELNLRDVRQLFHSLDPAPFRDKDLDPAAEQYIEDAVREIGHDRPMKMIVHLPAATCGSDDAQTLPAAIANYFAYRARQARIDLRRLLARGATSLAIGLVFLVICLSLRRSLGAGPGHEFLIEGLLIIGWVGLWRPLEIFLYDWWPIRRRQRRFEAIAAMPVEVVPRP